MKATALDALHLGYKIKIIKNCVMGVEKTKTKQILKELKKGGAKIVKPRKI